MKENLKKILKMLMGFGAIAFFIGFIAPAINEIPIVKEMTESNRENDIDAGTLFYTETEQFNTTNNYMENAKKKDKNHKE